jgi:hypothetical protein
MSFDHILNKLAEKHALAGNNELAFRLIEASAKECPKCHATLKENENPKACPKCSKNKKTHTSALHSMIKKYAQGLEDEFSGDEEFRHEPEDFKMEEGFAFGDKFEDLLKETSAAENPFEPGSEQAMAWSDGFAVGQESKGIK